VCARVYVCVCMYAHRSIHRHPPRRFVAGIGGLHDVRSMHSTDFGLGWEQVNLVVGRWGSRIKVRHHLLDTRFGRRSPPVPHLLQSRLGRRLQSLEVLALGLGPTHILDVGSHMAGAWDEVGFRECFAKAETSTWIPVHDHVMPKCVHRRLVVGEARVRQLVRSDLGVSLLQSFIVHAPGIFALVEYGDGGHDGHHTGVRTENVRLHVAPSEEAVRCIG
jgi:hypothetical protein